MDITSAKVMARIGQNVSLLPMLLALGKVTPFQMIPYGTKLINYIIDRA